MENTQIEELVNNLDEQSGSVLLRVETLRNIVNELGQLRLKMDEFDHSQDILRIHYLDVHQKIQLLDDLLLYTTNHLAENHAALHETQIELHDKVVKEND